MFTKQSASNCLPIVKVINSETIELHSVKLHITYSVWVSGFVKAEIALWFQGQHKNQNVRVLFSPMESDTPVRSKIDSMNEYLLSVNSIRQILIWGDTKILFCSVKFLTNGVARIFPCALETMIMIAKRPNFISRILHANIQDK